jgi:hypothetical protein
MRAMQRNNGWSIKHLARACAVCVLALAVGCSGDEPEDDADPMDGKPTSADPGATPSGSMGAVPSGSAGGVAPSRPAQGSDDEGVPNVDAPKDDPVVPGTDEEMVVDGMGPDGRITAACQGFPLAGMKHSPGGDALPNKCAPFDTSTNNPYAVRCIDAMPDFETPYGGDEYCILPPPPDQGFQLGVHPGGNLGYWDKMWAGDYSFYRDAAITKPYELAPGDETVQNYHGKYEVPADQSFFYRRQFRGRYGSHHGVVNFTRTQVSEEAWQPGGDLEFGGGEVMMVQNAHTDYPPGSLAIPPEEVGLGNRLSTTGATFNLHHFNITESALLRENWINVWYVPADQVTKVARNIIAMAPVDYPVGMVLDSAGAFNASGETQVLNLWGHHHAWTTRFHAWIERAGGGAEELIYDSYDWYDMPTFAYNSLVKNPEPGIAGQDGAYSGPITLEAGDVIRFNCHVETTQKHADALGVELPTAALRYGNQAIDAEMCILIGQQTGGGGSAGFGGGG